MTPDPHSPRPTPIAIACTTNPRPASAGAPLACLRSLALVPSQARAIERNTFESCFSTDCGKGSAASSAYIFKAAFTSLVLGVSGSWNASGSSRATWVA